MMTRILGMIVIVGLLSESAWAVDASALYDKKCKSCHSLGGVAGPMAKVGGPLDGVGSKPDEACPSLLQGSPKTDLLPVLDFDRAALEDALARVMPAPRLIAVSARSDEGMGKWVEWLEERRTQLTAECVSERGKGDLHA